MNLYIQFGSTLNFSKRINYEFMFDEIWIDRQLGFRPRKVKPCLENVSNAD